MTIQFGAEVVDKNGRILGTINHIVRDSWTGEIRKFAVQQKELDTDLFVSPQEVLEETESRITLNESLDELIEKYEQPQ